MVPTRNRGESLKEIDVEIKSSDRRFRTKIRLTKCHNGHDEWWETPVKEEAKEEQKGG